MTGQRGIGRMEMRGRPVAVIGLAVVIALGGLVAGRSSTLPRGGPGATLGGSPDEPDRDVGATDAATVVRFSVVLEQPGAAQLRVFLDGLDDPSSPDYRAFLPAKDFGRRFGLPDRDIDTVERWLEGRGFDVTSRPAQRTSLGVRGTAGQVEAAFGVALRDRIDPLGRRYHAPDAEPPVPTDLTSLVASITDLDSEPHDPSGVPLYGAPGGQLTPAAVARAYEIEAMHARGLYGEGQTIGIVSFDTFLKEDVDAFDVAAGIAAIAGKPSPAVRVDRLPDAGLTPGRNTNEVNLDIDVVRTIAPLAQIIDYEAPNDGAFAPVLREINDRGLVDIVTISWGRCERKKSASQRKAADMEFEAAYAADINVFVASGDHGAYGCRYFPTPTGQPRYRDLGLSADYPSVNPHVIAVGGTYLSVLTDGTYLAETAWDDALSGWATGGGVSTEYDRSAWQLGPGVDNRYTTGKRQVPDVAGPADDASGFMVVYTPPGKARRTTTSGGTSAASPFWAASMILVRQLAEQRGVGRDGRGRLGHLAPLLYDLAQSAPAGALFHDITIGGNLYHDATSGWDYATGLGSPRVGPLADAIIQRLGSGH